MPNQKIFIEGVGAAGKLVLSDKGRTAVNSRWNKRKITWKISCGNVEYLMIVAKTAADPFETPLPDTFSKKVTLEVKKDYPELDWEYCIHWQDKDGNTHISDPLIAIKPSLFHSVNYLVPLLVVSAISLIGLAIFSASKKNKR